MHTDLHREIDIAQGGLRKTGTPKAQRKRLRNESKKFLRKLKKQVRNAHKFLGEFI